MFARKLQHRRQNMRKKGKVIWGQAVFHMYLHIVLDRMDILVYIYILFYANLCANTI